MSSSEVKEVRLDDVAVASEGSAAGSAARRTAALARRMARRPADLLALAYVLLVVAWALLPGLLASADPLRADPAQALQAPGPGHWLGTDQLGRDIYARVVAGASLTMRSTLAAVAIGVVGGSALGLVSGYLRGVVDLILMRIVDVVLSIPVLLLAMVLVTAIGFGSTQLSIAVGVAMIGTITRIMRSEVVKLREMQYVDAARSFGAGAGHIILRHIAPAAIAPVIAIAVLEFGAAILAIAALSFLGYGTPPPSAEWGSMVAAGQPYLGVAWWISTGPGLVIALLVIAVNHLSRSLEGASRRV